MLTREEGRQVKLWGGIILAWLVLMTLLSLKALAQEPLHRFGVLPGEVPMDHYNVYLTCPPRSTAATSAYEYWAWRSLLSPPDPIPHDDPLETEVWTWEDESDPYLWTSPYTAWDEPSSWDFDESYSIDYLYE